MTDVTNDIVRLRKVRIRTTLLICAALTALALCACAVFPHQAYAGPEQQKQTVRISCDINNTLQLNSDGTVSGICAEYVEQLAWLNNWKLEYVSGSWTESVQNLQDGKIDILFPTQKTDARLETMEFSDYIGGYQPIGLFAKNDSELYLDDYESFNGKRIAVSHGSSNDDALKTFAAEKGFTYEEVGIDSLQDKTDALNNGSVDMIDLSTLTYIPNAKIVAKMDYLPFYYCTAKGNTALMQQLNDGMRRIMANNPQTAAEVYTSTLDNPNHLAFTRNEQQVIDSAPVVRIGMYDDNLPLSGSSGQNGQAGGIYTSLCEAMKQKTGLNIQIVLVPRSEFLYDHLDDGSLDFVICSSNLEKNTGRPDDYLASEPLLDYTTATVTRADYSFEGVSHPTYALTDGRRYCEPDIKATYPDAQIIYCTTAKDCLLAVQEGKADVTLLNTWEYNYQSKNPRFTDLMEWENMRSTAQLVLGARSDADLDLLNVMEKAVDQISSSEKEQFLTTNLNMPYASYDLADQIYLARPALFTAALPLVIIIVALGVYLYMRHRRMEELRAKNEELDLANRAKMNFMSRMSHELRTPLNIITGYTQKLKHSVQSMESKHPDVLEDLEAIQNATDYQLAIVKNLLDHQALQAGKLKIELKRTDSIVFLKNIVRLIKPEADRKGVRFYFDRVTAVNRYYNLDAPHVQQALMNVLHNAVKFTDEGGSVTMAIKTESKDDTHNLVTCIITDTGCGMDEDFVKNRLFKDFSQEQDGITSNYDGCGIGLALSKEIMMAMGGTITCTSKPNKGSSFSLALLIETADDPNDDPALTWKENLSGLNVLICEDNEMNRQIEAHLIARLGCNVDTVENGQEACERFEASEVGHFDIILMDIRMPVMDGLEATRRIRKMDREDAKTLPIIAISANAYDEDIQASLDAGMNEHVPKPIDARLLAEKLNRYCC